MTTNPSVSDVSDTGSLEEFLLSADLQTADPLEPVVLAEMSGFTRLKARDEGFASIFDAAAKTTQRPTPVSGIAEHSQNRLPVLLLHAFLRGLLFIAPIAPLLILLPGNLSRAEYRLVTVVVIVSWGAGMGLSHVTHSRVIFSPGSQFTGVLAWHAAVILCAVCVLLISRVVHADIKLSTIAWASLHFHYVLASNSLIATNGARLLGAIIAPGAVASFLHWSSGGTIMSAPHPLVFWVVLTSLLAAIVAALIRANLQSLGQPILSGRDQDHAVFGFVAYGMLIALIVLWLPMNDPGFVTSYLGLSLIVCLGFTEVAAQYVRSSFRRELVMATHVADFQDRALRRMVFGICAQLVILLSVLLVMALPLVRIGEGPRGVSIDTAAVLVLGLVQLLALLGIAFHAMGSVLRRLAFGVAGLVVTLVIDEIAVDYTISISFLVVASALAFELFRTVLRAARSPINHW